MKKRTIRYKNDTIPVFQCSAVVVGSGAASLKAADRLHQYGVEDIVVVTENLAGGTSRNTGSDKQTYYKLAVNAGEAETPLKMAEALYDGGCMHGDIALVEALGSLESFYHLVSIGVPFPHTAYGEYVGYKTDHDPLQRGTSIGPYTSRRMVESLVTEVRRRGVLLFDGFQVIALLVEENRTVGVLAIEYDRLEDKNFGLTAFESANVVFGTGGPGGLYEASVYPEVHIGGIGPALQAGAAAVNLTESQFGLSSIDYRWNVSGSYQQVVPSYISRNPDGSDETEFLNPFFDSIDNLAQAVFLKGYQWPFDSKKVRNFGSSLLDILVYVETVVKGKEVFLDFRRNPLGDERIGSFNLDRLRNGTAYDYLKKSGALRQTPIERLAAMNPQAVELYQSNGIDLYSEPLRIAVCAQHNNGGLEGTIWWESTTVKGLFPVGEVNGTHGVTRPGGSALNSGQVGAHRAAQRIANVYRESVPSGPSFERALRRSLEDVFRFIGATYMPGWGNEQAERYRRELQHRMTVNGAHMRESSNVKHALHEIYQQQKRIETVGYGDRRYIPYAFRNRELTTAAAAYLSAIDFYVEAGGGSRGSYLILDKGGEKPHPHLSDRFRYKAEKTTLRRYIQKTTVGSDGQVYHAFEEVRPVPKEEYWFEAVWKEYRDKKIFH